MEIKIVDRFTASGGQFYEWWLYGGPDGVEEVHGYATDMVTAFSKLLEWHERINADYAAEIEAELNTAKKKLFNKQ
jgi:hypothetical protein